MTATTTQLYYFIPADGGDMGSCCSDCLLDQDGHEEGEIANYGDESCDFCDFTTVEDSDEDEDEGW